MLTQGRDTEHRTGHSHQRHGNLMTLMDGQRAHRAHDPLRLRLRSLVSSLCRLKSSCSSLDDAPRRTATTRTRSHAWEPGGSRWSSRTRKLCPTSGEVSTGSGLDHTPERRIEPSLSLVGWQLWLAVTIERHGRHHRAGLTHTARARLWPTLEEGLDVPVVCNPLIPRGPILAELR